MTLLWMSMEITICAIHISVLLAISISLYYCCYIIFFSFSGSYYHHYFVYINAVRCSLAFILKQIWIIKSCFGCEKNHTQTHTHACMLSYILTMLKRACLENTNIIIIVMQHKYTVLLLPSSIYLWNCKIVGEKTWRDMSIVC